MTDQVEPEKQEDLQQKIHAWLQKEGYPLEFATADAFRRAGFSVLQGEYTQATEKEPRRELDVVAHISDRGDHLLRVEYVVECKWSGDKPWVLFGANRGMTTAACVSQSIGTQLAEALLWKEAGHDDFAKLGVFSSKEEHLAFGGRQAFSQSRDLVFDAIRAVTASCRKLADEYDIGAERALKSGRLPRQAIAIFPVVVVEGRLFKTRQSPDGPQLDEVPAARIHWRGSDRHRLPHATLDVVRADHIESFARERASDAKVMLGVMSSALDELRKCLDEGRLDHLNVTPGSRGMLGHPPLISHLLRYLRSNTERALTKGDEGPAPSTQSDP
jgi:hypothetical protein